MICIFLCHVDSECESCIWGFWLSSRNSCFIHCLFPWCFEETDKKNRDFLSFLYSLLTFSLSLFCLCFFHSLPTFSLIVLSFLLSAIIANLFLSLSFFLFYNSPAFSIFLLSIFCLFLLFFFLVLIPSLIFFPFLFTISGILNVFLRHKNFWK